MTEDFAGYPQSITEIKSDKTQKASDWTVRDALISMLRDLDAGEKYMKDAQFAVLIFGSIDEDNATHTFYANVTPNRYVHMGLVHDHLRRLIVKECTGEY